MFLTYPPFRHAFQPHPASTLWTCVEVALRWPWYIATAQDPVSPALRSFAISRSDELLYFAERAPAGRLVSLQLLMLSAVGDRAGWSSVPVVRIERCHDDSGAAPYAVVTAEDGEKFGGVPVAPFSPVGQQLVPVLNLENKGGV